MKQLFIGKCVIVMNNRWKDTMLQKLNTATDKEVRSFHNKTVWINQENVMGELSDDEINWVKQNSGLNSSYLPETYLDRVATVHDKELNNRGSIRKFQQVIIKYKTLSDVLNKSFGSNENGYSRRYPSAGALYTIVPILYNFLDSDDLSNGIYIYDSNNYDLLKVKDCSKDNQHLVNAMTIGKKNNSLPGPYAVGYALNINGSVAKYGIRGYRHGLIEVGLMSQAFRESCLECDLGEYCASAFDDLELTYESNLSVRDLPICLLQWFGVM